MMYAINMDHRTPWFHFTIHNHFDVMFSCDVLFDNKRGNHRPVGGNHRHGTPHYSIVIGNS